MYGSKKRGERSDFLEQGAFWFNQNALSNLAKEALSELKAEQPEIKEENLVTEPEEAPLELKEEASVEEEKKSE